MPIRAIDALDQPKRRKADHGAGHDEHHADADAYRCERQRLTRILASDEDATFHDQVGYWLWEPATGLVLQTLSIPRGQVAIASGHTSADATEFVLTAQRGDTAYGICSTAFLEYAFRTDAYRIEVVFNPDGSWSYVLDTTLLVRGRSEPFLHRDRNTLTRVAEPTPNPLYLLRDTSGRS